MTFTCRTILVLLSGVALVANGQGTIIYRDPPDIPVFGSGFPTIYDFDLNEDGVTDFQFSARMYQFMAIPSGQNAVAAILQPPGEFGSDAVAMQPGETVGANLTAPRAWAMASETIGGRIGSTLIECFTTGCYGYWQFPNGTAYMGVQFYIGSEIHYGSVHLRVFSNGGYIQDWAYNTAPDQAILAGAVPEPSTWALLSMGLAVVLIRRNKRM